MKFEYQVKRLPKPSREQVIRYYRKHYRNQEPTDREIEYLRLEYHNSIAGHEK